MNSLVRWIQTSQFLQPFWSGIALRKQDSDNRASSRTDILQKCSQKHELLYLSFKIAMARCGGFRFRQDREQFYEKKLELLQNSWNPQVAGVHQQIVKVSKEDMSHGQLCLEIFLLVPRSSCLVLEDIAGWSEVTVSPWPGSLYQQLCNMGLSLLSRTSCFYLPLSEGCPWAWSTDLT